jgi:hypothetical protein
VRDAADPDTLVQQFLQSTFAAAAELLQWPEDTVIGSAPSYASPPPG